MAISPFPFWDPPESTLPFILLFLVVLFLAYANGATLSTTHVSTGAIFGIGLFAGRADGRLISGILVA